MTPRHDFVEEPDDLAIIVDGETGDVLVPAAAALALYRDIEDPDLREPDLIARLAEVGWEWTRRTLADPAGSGDTITADFYLLPAP